MARLIIKFRHLILWSIIVGSDVNISGTPAYTENLPELKMYTNRFYQLSKIYLPQKRYMTPQSNIHVEFGDLGGNNVGLCKRLFLKSDLVRPIITIDKKAWDRFSKTQKEQLMFHELGHCALGRLHTEETISFMPGWDIGASLMHPYLDAVPTMFYSVYRKNYLEELFQN
jgi:hypothetical protein